MTEYQEPNILLDPKKATRALLIEIQTAQISKETAEMYLNELISLASTGGINVHQTSICSVRAINHATYLGKGKIEEFLRIVQEQDINLIILDDEISPSQERNLEKIFKIPVVDRTAIILNVFATHAKTKEARLQVELAQTRYQLPRLKNMWTHLSRQAGGGLYLKGEGEKQIEIDKRLVKRKLYLLEEELEVVQKNRETQRAKRVRSELASFAIVGYTNVGKSTLMNALTDAGILAEDKLFATLDTTTRKYTLPNNQEVLLTDTVGFIRKIPHLLVASFKSTLEEFLNADILLHIVDTSNPLVEEQTKTSQDLLNSLQADTKPIITVLNKIDKCPDPSLIKRLEVKCPKPVRISALNKTGIEDLLHLMTEAIQAQITTLKLRIPQSEYHLLSEILSIGRIIYQEYEENDILLRIEIPHRFAWKVKSYLT